VRTIVIYNPKSGSLWKRRKPVACLDGWMRQEGLQPEWWATQRLGDGTFLAKKALSRGAEMVVALGGDGTMNEVACGLAGHPVPMGILPGGTANVLAEELRIPLDLHEAIRLLREGRERKVSLGLAGGRPFLLWAGVGLDAAIAATMPYAWKRALGKTGFLLHGLLYWLRNPLPSFRLRIEDTEYSAALAIVANARCYGGGLRFTPCAEMTSELLDVCLLPSRRKLRYLTYLWAARTARLWELPDVTLVRAKAVYGMGTAGVPVQADGESIGALPMKFDLWPGALVLKVPK
jgi:diacylglycerol kinase (ATP)